MDEEKTNDKPEDTTKPEDKGDKPKAVNLVDGANLAAERMEAANAKAEELVTRQEEAAAKMILGGQAEAGQQPAKKEIDAEQYAKDVLAGKINNENKE